MSDVYNQNTLIKESKGWIIFLLVIYFLIWFIFLASYFFYKDEFFFKITSIAISIYFIYFISVFILKLLDDGYILSLSNSCVFVLKKNNKIVWIIALTLTLLLETYYLIDINGLNWKFNLILFAFLIFSLTTIFYISKIIEPIPFENKINWSDITTIYVARESIFTVCITFYLANEEQEEVKYCVLSDEELTKLFNFSSTINDTLNLNIKTYFNKNVPDNRPDYW